MRGWFRFVKAGIANGYAWLTGTPLSHLGALLLLLGVVGIPYVVAFSYESWAYTLVSLFVVGVSLFSIGAYRLWSDADQHRARLQEEQDRLLDRRSQVNATFDYDGDLIVFISNTGQTITDARINLFVPKLDGLTAQHLTDTGEVSTAGSMGEVAGALMHGVDGAYRWSELHVYLPGTNTTWGMRFRIGRIREPVKVHFGINADELGDWKNWEPTIYPLEGDEWEVDAAEFDPDYDEELDA